MIACYLEIRYGLEYRYMYDLWPSRTLSCTNSIWPSMYFALFNLTFYPTFKEQLERWQSQCWWKISTGLSRYLANI